MRSTETSADVYKMLSQKIKANGLVTRKTLVLVDGIPVRQALDSAGLPLLLLPLAKALDHEIDLEGRGLAVSSTATELVLRCLDPRLVTQFAYLADDMLVEVASTPTPSLETYLAVLDNWKALFSSASDAVLSMEQQIGLLAELHLLEAVLELEPKALAVWAGPRSARHDFQGADSSVEVKSTMKHHDFAITIHGFWQLEPPSGGALFVYAERVEQTVGAHGDSLPNAIARIHLLVQDHPAFFSLLNTVGYQTSRSDFYSEFRFEILEQRYCEVGPGFPRLSPSAIGEEITALIPDVQYTVNIGAVSPLATGDDALRRAAKEVLRLDA